MKAKLIKVALHDGYRLDDENGLYIASTLESSKSKLSLKNCQAIELGYDLEQEMCKLVDKKAEQNNTIDLNAYAQGCSDAFQKALELMGDKKFSEEDMFRMFTYGHALTNAIKLKAIEDKPFGEIFNDFIQSLQQTEWDVEVLMENSLINGYRNQAEGTIGFIAEYESVPKLDAAGCLILKRINL